MSFQEQLDYYTGKLALALQGYEEEHPHWQTECLLWITDQCLGRLRRYLENPDESEISWDYPFVELHFPVDCNWQTTDAGPTFTLNSGVITKDDLKDEESALQTLTKIMVRQIEIVTLQDVTHGAAYSQEGGQFYPMLSPESIQRLQSIASDQERSQELRSLLQPCSFGAGTIELPDDT